MKKLSFFLFLGCQTLFSQNLVNNGDFESWNNGVLSYWKLAPNSTNSSNASSYAGGGINGSIACFLSIGFNYRGSISQYMTIPSRYTKVTFKYKFSTNATGHNFKVELHRPTSPYPSTIIAYTQTIQSSNLGSWQTFSAIYDIASNSSVVPPYTLGLYITPNSFDFNNVGPYILIDDVQVISSNNLVNLAVNESQEDKKISINNPIRDKIKILSNKKVQKIEIIDMTGKLVKNLSYTENDISDLTSGNYFLKIFTVDGVVTKKMIKL